MNNITAVRHGKRHTSLTETIPIEQAAGGSHATGSHAPPTETIPIVQVSPPADPEASALNGVSPIPNRDSGQEPEAVPGGKSEGGHEQPPDSAFMDWHARFREHMPARRSEWPVEAERSSERLKFNQSKAVELLVSGMTITAAAGQLGVHRGTIHRWFKDPILVAELEARRSELADSLLDLHVLGHRIGMGKLLELVESANESLALRAATTLVNSGQRAYQCIDEKKRRERLEDHLGIIYGFKV